jgi:hypothetical protein
VSDQLQRMIKKLEGDGPVEKHILLLKLSEALQGAPAFGDKPTLDASTPQRQWLAEVGALLSRLGFDKKTNFRASFQTLHQFWKPAINQIKGQVIDAIEELKLELELDGRSDIGNAYAPGDAYRFFVDLRAVVDGAIAEVFVVDPYFNGEAFDGYLSAVPSEISVKILADRYSKDVHEYAKRHVAQFSSRLELRSSKELHDRLVLVDHDVAWIMGGSIKDAGKKATYLIPVAGPIAKAKNEIYDATWARAEKLL